jgi:hypothetical protein
MRHSLREFEARLAKVEQELEALKITLGKQRAGPWYRQILGDFAGDETFAEIIRLGRAIRRGKIKG